MLEKIFDMEAIIFMNKISGETEDNDTVRNFREYLIQNVDYNTIMMIAKKWDEVSELHQVDVAIDYVGEEHASRFMMFMDYLAEKIKEGTLYGL